eukprot:TRINITY_DN3799_c0_g1_i1.p1 TRINITY_DN3799_c0_g1~~TRINITY_DN3799_c0_g1_i1.p1  ORF type:complete len:347 (+),score=86.63 TRINITY_DN3799_c0_g1_i1:71-1042(+)
MSRHSKNSCSRAFFSYSEREKAGYGTRKQRLSTHSLLHFDECSICLHKAKDPVATQQGHMFCRECVYGYILRERLRLADEKTAREKEESRRKEAEEAEKARKEASKGILLKDAMRLTNGKKKPDDRKTVAMPNAKEEERGEEETAMPKQKDHASFWLPEHTPTHSFGEGPGKIVEQTSGSVGDGVPRCPVSGNPLRRKDLQTLHFWTVSKETPPSSLSTSSSTKARRTLDLSEGELVCPVCLSSLKNGAKLYAIRSCGDVLCTSCKERFVGVEKGCPACGKEFLKLAKKPGKKGFVLPLVPGGTGFASHNVVEASKYRPQLGF